MIRPDPRFSLTLALALAACADGPALPPGTGPGAPVILAEDSAPAPEGAPAGTCYARTRAPAQIETVTEHVLISPKVVAADGSLLRPASYRTVTAQRFDGGGEETLIETPCRAQMTPEFIASAQRALAARRLYAGPVNGVMDGQTRAALRRLQQTAGLDSAIMAMSTARELGLIAYPFQPG